MKNIAKNLHNTKDVCTFAVLTVRILGGCLYVVIVLFFGAKYVGL